VPLAPSPSICTSPITVGHATNPAMVAGARVLWSLRSSPTEPRAPTITGGAGGVRALRLATGSDDPDGRNQPVWFFPHLYCICMFQVFQVFQIYELFNVDVAKVDREILHMLQVFQRHILSVCSKYFIYFHMYVVIVFYLDVAYIAIICSNILVVSALCCSKSFHVASCKCFILDDVSCASHTCKACSKCFICF
jgi:hypothetical protein